MKEASESRKKETRMMVEQMTSAYKKMEIE